MQAYTDRLSAAFADRYRILRHLGEGGMATVYLAEDLKHDRQVAIKVLRPELAAVLGAERFVQEIKTTASLQHPHILPLFDSGTASVPPLRPAERGTGGEATGAAGQDFLFYVMPYIEGETLRDKLNRETQLGIEEAVKIATEVADALDYAHRQGVIHRDIKPENILLHDGRPMVADFGIALAVSAAAGGRMTETGMSLGTPHYMSPEQATADRDLTNRSDIYSLGSVLYEMLTGEPPHLGNSAQQIIMKIVTDTPRPVTELRKSVPPHVAAATARALEKLPADRFLHAKAFADALANPQAMAGVVPGGLRPAQAPGRHPVATDWRMLTVALIAGTAIGGLTTWSLQRSGRTSGMISRFEERPEPPPGSFFGSAVALSPDGKVVVYTTGMSSVTTASRSRSSSGQRLYVRPLDRLASVLIPGTEGAYTPFFSPDGRWVGYMRGSDLMKVRLDGSPPVLIARDVTSADVRGASWGSKDEIILVPAGSAGLVRVPAGGGEPHPVGRPRLNGKPVAVRWPHVLPGGEYALVTIWSGSLDDAIIGVTSLTNGEVTALVPGTGASYATTGHIVFARADGSLLAAPFDLATRELSGSPVAIEQNLRVYFGGATQYALSASGTLVYRPIRWPQRSMVTVDRSGAVNPLPAEVGPYIERPRISPDGLRIVTSVAEGNGLGIWLFDVAQRTSTRITEHGQSGLPSWAPDGYGLTFQSNRAGSQDLYSRPWDRSAPAQPIIMDSIEQWNSAWSRPDSILFFDEVRPSTSSDISYLRVGRDTTARRFLDSPSSERAPSPSPDDKWLAYVSDDSGRDEVYVVSYPGGGGRRSVSSNGGDDPVWSPRGDEIFYRNGDSLMAARVEAGSDFRVVNRSLLFERELVRNGFDVHPDGDRFVMLRTEREDDPTIVIVLNWLEYLQERMASSGEE